MAQRVDPRVLGHRIRHFRRLRGMTLEQLGSEVGKPAPYLSTVENGKRELRLGLVNDLAAALGVATVELLKPEAPSRRAHLEIEWERIQEDPTYAELSLPHFKPTASIPDAALEHLVRLFHELKESRAGTPDGDGHRSANVRLRAEMKQRDNYFGEVEAEARSVLKAVGYSGGAFTHGDLHTVAAHLGFEIVRVHDVPPGVRSVTDLRHHRIYVPQRDLLSGHQERSVIAQTLGHFALRHDEPESFEDYLRQRVEANYFAGAILLPESAVVPLLHEAKTAGDISIEDLQDAFSVSYEMAAHRFTNLATEHFALRVHFVKSDEDGIIWKAYENNDVPFPQNATGAIEGQRLCREWGTRQAFHSRDKFAIHYQYTRTVTGTYWCATHVEENRRDAITTGVHEGDAKYFRGADTDRWSVSSCPQGPCCKAPPEHLESRWGGFVWPSVRGNSHVLVAMQVEDIPEVDLPEIYAFLDRNAPTRR